MTWSLLNTMVAASVEALLTQEPVRQDLRDDERMMPREEALRIIHATLWAYSSRGGDFSGAYAISALADALKERLPMLEAMNKMNERAAHSAGAEPK